MSGLALKEMEASEMIDVLHFFFEEDLFVVSEEEMEAKSSVRTALYQSFYGETYKYAYKKNDRNRSASGNSFDPNEFHNEDLIPFDPSAPPKPTKPYTPPTDFVEESPLPFGELLDGPIQ